MSELEEEILNKITNEFAQDIDNEILITMMGWTKTPINPAWGTGSIVDEIDWYAKTAEWIHINVTGDYKLLKGQWFFERQEDAVMFTLKWS